MIVFFTLAAAFLWIFQLVFAYLAYRIERESSVRLGRVVRDKHLECVVPPKVSVIIPTFNESPYNLNRTIQSVLNQRGIEIEIIVIDDGSPTPVALDIPDVTLFTFNHNRGKKHAQIHGIKKCSYDWIVTIDSDTRLEPEAIINLYITAVKENADAVSGTIRLLNEDENILTKITSTMYWFSFNQDRASQSYFGCVICCSGAMSLYKKDTIIKNTDLYLSQKFFSIPILTGDDRHLTNIFLMNGKRVCWSQKALGYTVSPPQLIAFLKQQIRWTRSIMLCSPFILKNARRWSPMFIFLNLQVLFKYVYYIYIYFIITYLMAFDWSIFPFFVFIAVMLLVSAARASIGYLYTKSFKFGWLILYSLFAFFILTPVLLYALATPHKEGWLTRKDIV